MVWAISELSDSQSSPPDVFLLECLHLDDTICHVLQLTLDRGVRACAHSKEGLPLDAPDLRSYRMDEGYHALWFGARYEGGKRVKIKRRPFLFDAVYRLL